MHIESCVARKRHEGVFFKENIQVISQFDRARDQPFTIGICKRKYWKGPKFLFLAISKLRLLSLTSLRLYMAFFHNITKGSETG